MVDNKKLEMVIDLINTIDYDEYKDEIDEKCKNLIREWFREKKIEKGYTPPKMDSDDYLDLREMLKKKPVMRNLKKCKFFNDYYNSL